MQSTIGRERPAASMETGKPMRVVSIVLHLVAMAAGGTSEKIHLIGNRPRRGKVIGKPIAKFGRGRVLGANNSLAAIFCAELVNDYGALIVRDYLVRANAS